MILTVSWLPDTAQSLKSVAAAQLLISRMKDKQTQQKAGGSAPEINAAEISARLDARDRATTAAATAASTAAAAAE